MPYRIAVIDDDPDILLMLEEVLMSDGHRVLCYTVGNGAYEWIRGEQPDLIILDLWMETPDTGNAVLGLLQKDPATRSIPIIVFSGYLQTWQLEAVLPTERRVAHLAKPASLDDILGLVTTLLPAGQREVQEAVRVNVVNAASSAEWERAMQRMIQEIARQSAEVHLLDYEPFNPLPVWRAVRHAPASTS